MYGRPLAACNHLATGAGGLHRNEVRPMITTPTHEQITALAAAVRGNTPNPRAARPGCACARHDRLRTVNRGPGGRGGRRGSGIGGGIGGRRVGAGSAPKRPTTGGRRLTPL